jgi:N-acylneuraminate cytidylyltransferase/CMP-N,N'-diacetyllegionaminic acid synthase
LSKEEQMINGKKIIAIVPARQGSKGLAKKNLIDFLGKPLLAWSIEAAVQSNYVDRIIVSTDSTEIAGVGEKFGADIPFIRPSYLSEDNSTSVDVIYHAIEFMSEKLGENFDFVILLEPTSPLRTSEDVDLALEKLIGSPDARSLVSVGESESQHNKLQFNITESEFISVEPPSKKFVHVRRQDLARSYFLDGSIYLSYIHTLFEFASFVHGKTLTLSLSKWKNIEIDDEYDYVMALALGRKYLK